MRFSVSSFLAFMPFTTVLAAPLEATKTNVSNATHVEVARQAHTQGTATFFFQNGGIGSCGEQHSDNEFLVAMASSFNNEFCGRGIIVTNINGGQGNGNQVSARIVDTCPSCASNDLDLSVGAFSALTNGDLDLGVIAIDCIFMPVV
ncbi:hypothetical protein M501DRAFT_1031176 [Patellaria atrata CBS 101060]|uniref:Uncharacterized protein n=1 Tax=Patellaria atrata CBS 101060 TaxID=1346257 RepID=A0A9P4SC09_9PEZI|nr:hypothetical protein M501DRAFT_1031176 [Patellaria atrata CBS 101060]